jgi:hypothetical protein
MARTWNIRADRWWFRPKYIQRVWIFIQISILIQKFEAT